MNKETIFNFIKGIAKTAMDNQINNNETSTNNNEINTNNTVENNIDVNVVASDTYTELPIYGATLMFKQATPTNLWNCEDDFGAGEIDTVFLPSKDGQAIDNYFNTEKISGINFITSDDVVDSSSNLINKYKNGMELMLM